MISEYRGHHNNPFTSMLDQRTLRSIKKTIRKQVDFEKKLSFDEFGHSHVADDPEFSLGFNINSLYAEQGARNIPVFLKIYDLSLEGASILDVGGANPGFLNAVAEVTGANFDGTFTSLSDLPQGDPSKYKYKKMAAEIPPAEYYRKFDLVVSMNGPLVWSAYPELSLKNMIKMVKPGGHIFLGIHRNLHDKSFSPHSLLYGSPEIGAVMPLIVKKSDAAGELEYIFAEVK